MSLPTRDEFLQQLNTLPIQACAAIDNDIANACPICAEKTVDTIVNADDERAVLLHGRHAFGENCARSWLAENNTCPKCRDVLFRGEDDTDSEWAESDDGMTVAAPADEGDAILELMHDANELATRDSSMVIPTDREIMEPYVRLWRAWQVAMDANDDPDGQWAPHGAASIDVANRLHQLLQARLRWWRQGREHLNINISEPFDYPAGSWPVTARDITSHVRIDFDCDLQSEFRRELHDELFMESFGRNGVCNNVAGHPMAFMLLDRIDGLLQNYAGRRLRVGTLMRKLRRELGDPDEMERNLLRNMPALWPSLVRYLIDETTKTAILRTNERRRLERELRRVEQERARRAARGQAQGRPVSTCPRMSAPSTRN